MQSVPGTFSGVQEELSEVTLTWVLSHMKESLLWGAGRRDTGRRENIHNGPKRNEGYWSGMSSGNGLEVRPKRQAESVSHNMETQGGE